ncbi:hypothetical protein MY9_2194 [Bacillus sp. JS]|nr:hypothetical protein MY9_2194 [Bacillus sp. JS]
MNGTNFSYFSDTLSKKYDKIHLIQSAYNKNLKYWNPNHLKLA